MHRVLLAELAVLIELQTIRVVLLILVRTVVAAVALRALQRDIVAHPYYTPYVAKVDFFIMSLIQFSTVDRRCQHKSLTKGNLFAKAAICQMA